MLNFLSKILFIFTILIFGCLIVHDAEAKSKVKLSRKYIPPGNPGGANFHADEEFAESYKLYEKRRELMKKKKIKEKMSTDISKENLIKNLQEKKIASLNKESDNVESCIIDDEENTMVNQHGVNVARLKGAIFIDDSYQDPIYQDENGQVEDNQREKKPASTREKKVSPLSVTIEESTPKGTCSRDSLSDLDDSKQYSLNGSSSFGSVIDTVE